MKSTDTSVKEREINLEDAGGGNKKNKQWLRFGATSLLIAIGMGANTGGDISASEETTIDDADASLVSSSDKDDDQDIEERDKDGDGLDDETGEPVPTNPSDPDSVVASAEATASEESVAESVAETPVDPVVVESASSETSSLPEESVTSSTAEVSDSESVVQSPVTSQSSLASSVVLSTTSAASESSAESTDASSEASQTDSDSLVSVAPSSEASSATSDEESSASDSLVSVAPESESDTLTSVAPESEAESSSAESAMSSADSLQSVAPSSSQSATVLGSADSTTEETETVPDGITVPVNTTIEIPNAESFTGSDYGLSSTVTVTYVDKYLWINLPDVYNFNSIDMDALKAYAVRNRMVISFLQEGEHEKDSTTGLTEAQQATFDLFNKASFNLMPETEVTNDDGTIIVYWPDSTEASTTFDSVDHDDIRVWAETNGLGWVVASEAWRRINTGQTPPAGDQVLDTSSSGLPNIIKNDANLLRTYFPLQYFLSASGKVQYVVLMAREGTTRDPWGTTIKGGETLMIAEFTSTGIIRTNYINNGQVLTLNGTTITNRFSAGSGDYNITNYYNENGTTLQSWTMQGITTKSTLADANYYYAIDNGDGTYTKTDIRIPVNTSAGSTGDAKVNTLTGGSGGSFPDEYIITSDVLSGYQLVPSLTYASGQMSSTTTGSGTGMTQTVRGKFMTNVYDQMSKSGANMYRTVLDPNNPFNLALVRAYGFDLSKVPVGAVVDKYVNSSGGYTVTIAWPVVDANGNETGQTSIIWDTGSNTIRFDTSASGGAATNPVKHYTIPTSPLTFYLQTNTATGATSIVAATSQPTTSGYTFAKITGDIYKTTTGTLTFSATDAFGNANTVVSTPDWLDEDRNGSIDGGSFTGFKNGGYGDKQNSFTIIGKFNVSGVNFYYVAAPQMATVGLKTAEKQSDGTYKLVDTARTNTDGVSNYNNKTSGQKDSALQGVTGAVIGVARTESTANDWAKINTKVPGYTYIGYTYNGGALQSVQKTDGTYAMPYENSNAKYNATASTSVSNGAITDSSADAIVLYYAIDSQQAQIKFVMADGTTAPANINLTGKTGEALSQDIASSIPAGYHIDTSKTTTTGSPAMTLSGTTVSGTYDATNNNLSTTDSSLQTMTITLVADTQTVKVRYIDVNASDKTTGWTADDGTEITDWVQTVTGDTGKTYTNVPWGMSTTGYVVVAQDAGTRSGTFDNDTNTDQTYYVYLKHNTVSVEGGKEGNATWTTRSTVRYRYEDGTTAAAANVRTITFTATVTYDAVTGEALYDTWDAESYTFDDVESPVIQGYIADKLQAGSGTVTNTSAGIVAIVEYKALGAWTPDFPDTTPDNPPTDVTYPNDPDDPTQPDRTNPSVPVVPYVPGYTPEGPNSTPLTPVNPDDPTAGYLPPDVPDDPTADTTIVYHANDQKVTVNYIYVADDGTRTQVHTESFSGKSNADYTHELWEYETNPDQSYVLVSKDAGAESGKFDADDDTDQVYNVILAIGTESVPGGKTDDPNYTDYTKTITRTIKYVDQDGNQMVDANGNLVPDSFMEHTFTATVTYKVNSSVPVSVEWPNDSATFAAVKSPVITGYVADVTQVDADQIDHNDSPTTYTVTYKPMGSWTPSFPPNTENVPSDPIQYPNDPNNPTDNETPHDPAEPGDPVIPYVPGYTPEGPDGTPLKPVDPENPSAGYIPPAPTDPTGDTTINYTRNTQQVIVRYIDDTTNLEVTELRQTFSGETDQAYTNTLSDYATLGYTFVSAEAGATAGTYDRDDAATQTYTVHLNHGTVVVEGGREDDPNHGSYTSTVTSTVHYIYEADNSTAEPDSVQKKTFTASVTYDAVTGEVVSIVWPTESQNFDDVQTPVIDGYFASEGVVAGGTVDYNDASREETVTYTKLGSWIPHVPDLPEDEQLKTRVYPNDPNDASKVWTRDDPNYVEVPVPYIPGYTPTTDGSSTPLEQIDPNDVTKGYYPPDVPDNPAADTPIYYVAHPQTLVVVYVDISSGTEVEVTELQQTLTGTTNAAYTNTLSDYAARGYVLVNQDATATEGTYDDADNVTQFAKVYLDHGTVIVTPDNPGDPGNPMYPDVPGTPTWPGGTDLDGVKQTINGVINYQYENGDEAFPDVTRTVTFERSITLDAVTGEQISTTDWVVTAGDDDWPETPSPVKEGYYADISDILAVTIAPGDFDRSYMVTYYPMGQYVPVFPEGTENVPSDPITYPNDPDNPGDPLEPGEGTPATPGDSDNPTLPYVPGFTPEGPDGTPLEPVDPNNPSAGYWPPATPTDNPGGDTTITYTANEQKATVTFIDDTTGDTLKVVDLTGKSDETDAYRTATDIATYERAGYVLVSDDYPTDFTFDRDTTVTQAYKVTLTHGSQTIDPNDPKTPGTPINPDNPDGPKYPDGLKSTDLNESVTRTITYVDQAGKTMATEVKETIHFTRTATLDTVTGAYTYSAWVPTTVTSMDAVDSPVIAGYVADRQTVAALPDLTATSADVSEKVVYSPIGQYVPSFPSGVTDVPSTPIDYPNNPDDPTTTDTPGEDNPATPGTPDNPTMPYVPGFTPQGPDGEPLDPVDPDNPSSGYWPPAPSETPTEDTTITYTANKQTATITYINDETGSVLAVDTITGGSAETSTYTAYNRIMVYKLAGMMLVSNGYPSHFTFDRDETVDQAFEVHFKGATITVTPDDPKVPGDPIYQPGDLIDPNDPDSPTFPDPLGEPGTPVDPDDPDSPTWPQPPVWPDGVTAEDLREEVNQTITYIYEKDGSTAAKTVTDQVVFTRTITINVIAAQESAQPRARLARAATSSAIVYSDWQAVNGDDTFDAKTSPVIPGYIADRLVVDEVAGMDETSEDDIQQVVYRQLGSWVPSVPQVPGVKTPGEVTYPNDPDDPTKTADPNSPGYPVIPYVPGFTPQGPDGTPLQPVDPKNPSKGYLPPAVPSDPTADTTIVYTVDRQHAKVNFIDQNTKQVLHVEQLSGDSYSKSSYTTAEQIAYYVAQGYVLVRDGYPAGGMTFDADSTLNQTFAVTLAHGTKTVDPNNPGVPGTPIDPNNPDGPKWPAGVDEDHLKTSTTRTIIFRTSDGTIVDTKTQIVTYTRTATVDTVTGEVTYGPWTAPDGSHVPDVAVPGMPGYVADRDLVPGVDIPVGTPNFTEYVTYTVVPEQTTAEVGPNELVIVPEVLTPHSLAYTAVQSATATTESAASLAYTAEQSAAESATTQHSGVLPYTGSDEQEGAKATGLAMLFGLFLGLFKRRKRKDEAEETSKKHDDK
ncbi:mucin-binding protein [Weissella confusa]|uniref:mucin-binding protein n=1 Tax=Weissella confusa TaxID=1583 RepID=UPI001F54A590|nr:LPXTG cell wall anchor domain-containing protein [Weissella confusa]